MQKNKRNEEMNSRERVMTALVKKEVDRKPVINPVSIACIELMESVNTYFPDVHTDPEKMALLAAAGYEILGFDSIAPYFSVQQEAAALGMKVEWGSRNQMPDHRGYLYTEPAEIKIPLDFMDHPAITTVIEALKLLKKLYRDQVCLIGKVMGPWTLAYHLFGVENFLIDTIQAPKKINEILDILKEVSIKFAEAQLEAGADFITLADHATGDLISPQGYARFLKPVHQKLAQRIKGPIILHICGRTVDRIPDIAETGVAVFHFESKNTAVEAREAAGLDLVLTGNINNPQTLLSGTPEDVKKEVNAAIRAGIEMISPECAVPLTTPVRNLQAIVEGVKRYKLGY